MSHVNFEKTSLFFLTLLLPFPTLNIAHRVYRVVVAEEGVLHGRLVVQIDFDLEDQRLEIKKINDQRSKINSPYGPCFRAVGAECKRLQRLSTWRHRTSTECCLATTEMVIFDLWSFIIQLSPLPY